MAALLTMGWAGAVDGSRSRRRFDIVSTLAAALMITASVSYTHLTLPTTPYV